MPTFILTVWGNDFGTHDHYSTVVVLNVMFIVFEENEELFRN